MTLLLLLQQASDHTTEVDSVLLNVIIGVASAALILVFRSIFDKAKANRDEILRNEAQQREDIAVLAEEQELIKKNYNDKFQKVYDKLDDNKLTLSKEIAAVMLEVKNLALTASDSFIKRGECPFYQDPEGYIQAHASRHRSGAPSITPFRQGE